MITWEASYEIEDMVRMGDPAALRGPGAPFVSSGFT
jgi:hypothetical protein